MVKIFRSFVHVSASKELTLEEYEELVRPHNITETQGEYKGEDSDDHTDITHVPCANS